MNDSLGIFTPSTLALYQYTNQDNPVNLLKRAAIFFEKLVIYPHGLGDFSELNNVISPEKYYFAIGGRESFCNSKEYQQMFLVLNDLLDDKKSFYEQLHDTNNSDLWGGENNNNYQEFVSACVCKDLNIQRPKDNYYEWQESMKFYLPAISLDIKLFAQLSNNFKNASGLLSELHQSAIVNAFQQRMPDPDLVLTSVSKITSFDFAQLTWEQIFYLRRHKFTKEFRIKVKEWIERCLAVKDTDTFVKSLDSYIKDTMFELIGKTQPHPKATAIKGLLGIVPIPLNPLTFVSPIYDTVKELKLISEYSWLYFIQESKNKFSQQRIK